VSQAALCCFLNSRDTLWWVWLSRNTPYCSLRFLVLNLIGLTLWIVGIAFSEALDLGCCLIILGVYREWKFIDWMTKANGTTRAQVMCLLNISRYILDLSINLCLISRIQSDLVRNTRCPQNFQPSFVIEISSYLQLKIWNYEYLWLMVSTTTLSSQMRLFLPAGRSVWNFWKSGISYKPSWPGT
jgi:hypothetical protein